MFAYMYIHIKINIAQYNKINVLCDIGFKSLCLHICIYILKSIHGDIMDTNETNESNIDIKKEELEETIRDAQYKLSVLNYASASRLSFTNALNRVEDMAEKLDRLINEKIKIETEIEDTIQEMREEGIMFEDAIKAKFPVIKHLISKHHVFSNESNPSSSHSTSNNRLPSQQQRIYSVLQNGPATAIQIADALGVSPSAIWRNLKLMEESGYIVKRDKIYYIP